MTSSLLIEVFKFVIHPLVCRCTIFSRAAQRRYTVCMLLSQLREQSGDQDTNFILQGIKHLASYQVIDLYNDVLIQLCKF